jgi:hypothetical protein
MKHKNGSYNKLNVIIPVFIVTGFFIKGCYYDSKEYLFPDIGTNTCDTVNFTYSEAVQPILDQYCVSCHSSSFPSGNVKLDNYTNVKIYADNGKLLGTISHASGYSPMPQGASKLDDCKILTISKWIDAGAPNN